MRSLKKTVIVSFIIVGMVAVLLFWLVVSEQGSRWLLERKLDTASVTIEIKGVTGALVEGINAESVSVLLTDAEVKATHVSLSWHLVSLFAGTVDIIKLNIAELAIDLLENENTDGSDDESADSDQLFWLQLPIPIQLESGQIDKFRIEDVAFEKIYFAGIIGNEQLQINALGLEVAGVKLRASGELLGPDPGQLNVVANWEIPDQDQRGAGSFSGDIKELAFTQVLYIPEVVNFNGTIFNLFDGPTLQGKADWVSVKLPGESVVYSNTGDFTIHSDFLSARIDGDSTVLLDNWPPARVQLQALVDLQGITIDSYVINALTGRITGQGAFAYSDDFTGQLQINAKQINTALIKEDFPVRMDFNASLKVESMDDLTIDVSESKALFNDTLFIGTGRVQWQAEELLTLDADIHSGINRLTADVKLSTKSTTNLTTNSATKLAGSLTLNAPELQTLQPGLQGKLVASIILGGSTEQPQAHITADAESVSFNAQSLEKLNFVADLRGESRIKAKLVATGLAAETLQLGNLDVVLDGALADHQSTLNLSGGEVDVKLGITGGWDGETVTQRFEHGYVQASGLERWHLEKQPQLQLSAETGKLSAHCWKQRSASVCIDASNWGPDSLQSHIEIKDFALTSLQPLLADDYRIDGTVNADIKFMRNSEGLQKRFQWRQSRTLISYSDDAETVNTVIDSVNIDFLSDDRQTNFSFTLTGEQGLNLVANAAVNGPLVPESRLKAAAKGLLPSIELLRPLAQRVLHPGQLQGELAVDIAAGGTLGHPVFIGGAKLTDGIVEFLDAGVTLHDINIAAKSRGNDKLQINGDLRSGDGSASMLGEVRMTEETGLVADIHIQGQNLASVRTADLIVDASPDIKLHIAKDVFDISGTIMIPRASANIRKLPKNTVPLSDDVVVHELERKGKNQDQSIVTGNIEVLLGDDVRFSGFGLRSRLEGDFRLTQARGSYLNSGGTIRVHDGFFTGYGKELRVDRGELTFTGPLDDPLINIQVSRESIYESRQYTVGVRLTGSAQNVKTETFSRPVMSEQDVLSFLLIDRPSSSGDDASGAALALGLQQLIPGEGGILGLDEINFETNDANQATMVAGKRINDKLHVRYVFGTSGQPGDFRIRYRLSSGFSLESSTGSRQSLDLIYLLER